MDYREIMPDLLRKIADAIQARETMLSEGEPQFYWTVFGRSMFDLDSAPQPTLGSVEELNETVEAVLRSTRPLGDVDIIRVGDLMKLLASMS